MSTTFEELCSEYKEWRTRCVNDEFTSVRFAYGFAEGFRAHVGAPVSFEPASGEGKPSPYVIAMKFIDHGDDTYELVEPEHTSDVIQRHEDGFWWYGIGIVLEIGARMFPKQNIGIPIHFMVDDNHCKMHITNLPDGEFDFDISSITNYTEAYEFIVSLLFTTLRAKPSDQILDKRRIGFVISSASQE